VRVYIFALGLCNLDSSGGNVESDAFYVSNVAADPGRNVCDYGISRCQCTSGDLIGFYAAQ